MGFKYLNQIAEKKNLETFLELVDLAAGSGQDVNNAIDLSKKLHETAPMKVCLQILNQDADCAQMLKERYVGSYFDLETMLKMPKGSLGWTYAKVLSTLGYDPQFYRNTEDFKTDADYVTFRVYKTHDLHHILTGYSLDDLGELGVISVSVGQFGYPGFTFLDLISFLLRFFTNEQVYDEQMTPQEKVKTLNYAFKLVSAGLEMGQAAKPLFPIKWEENLERPLDEWREMLNIKPVLTGPYSWYTRKKIKEAIA
jgi:ubiquinone biosynthesis protein COQ4